MLKLTLQRSLPALAEPARRPSFIEAFQLAQTLHSTYGPFSIEKINRAFVPEAPAADFVPQLRTYEGAGSTIVSPAVPSKALEELYLDLISAYRTPAAEIAASKLSPALTEEHFAQFTRNVIENCAFEDIAYEKWLGKSYGNRQDPAKSEAAALACIRLRQWLKTSGHKDIWGYVKADVCKAFRPRSGVEHSRLVVAQSNSSMGKGLLHVLLQRSEAFLRSAKYADALEDLPQFQAVIEVFRERVVQSLTARIVTASPIHYVLDRILDSHDEHLVFLRNLEEHREGNMPEFCAPPKGKRFQELGEDERAAIVRSHAVFRDYYLGALSKYIPRNAAKCLQDARQRHDALRAPFERELE